MSWIKVIFLNILIIFSFIGMILLAPPILVPIYKILFENKSVGSAEKRDKRAELHIYIDIPWAERHFLEFSELSTTYYDYITWRRDDFTGKTINISDGVRTTAVQHIQNNDIPDYYFFGGSTTWGTGVNDANTYPSLFAQRIGTQVFNFGETGYISRQSLSYLNNFLIVNSINDISGGHVVFYDGVNDVAHRCRSEISDLGTSREKVIQNKLSPLKSYSLFSFSKLFEQLNLFLQGAIEKLGIKNTTKLAEQFYSCSSNSDRAEEVARALVETWQTASDLVTKRGGNFTAILQPVAFIGNPDINYLDLTSANDLALDMQYKAVYPLIRQFAKAKNIDFVDLSLVYDKCDNCYIDFCHVGPQAHKILVENLVYKLAR
jgi:hypothetical protein